MSPRRIVALLLLLLHAQGCMTWRPTKLAPQQVVQKESEIRVKLGDASVVQVRKPWVHGDTLGGARLTVRLPSGELDRSQPIPLDSVYVIETQDLTTLSKVITVVVALPVAVVGAIVYGLASGSGGSLVGPLCSPCLSPL